MIDQATIGKAVDLLRQAAPGAKIILFGSYARGEARPDSDLDFLVVKSEVANRWLEMVRLRDVLRPLRVPADVLVISQERFEYWKDTPGTVYYEAARGGRVYHGVEPAG